MEQPVQPRRRQLPVDGERARSLCDERARRPGRASSTTTRSSRSGSATTISSSARRRCRRWSARPSSTFPGLTIGAPYNLPSVEWQRILEARYELNRHQGSHDLKIGGEFLHVGHTGYWHIRKNGVFTMTSVPSNLSSLIPADSAVRSVAVEHRRAESVRPSLRPELQRVWLAHRHPSSDDRRVVRRQLAREQPPDRQLRRPVGRRPRRVFASRRSRDDDCDQQRQRNRRLRLQDGHARSSRLRAARRLRVSSWRPRSSSVAEADCTTRCRIRTSRTASRCSARRSPARSRRPRTALCSNGSLFITNPTCGATADQFFAGHGRRPAQSPRIISPDYKNPYTWQSSIGFQKQMNSVTGIEADLTHYNEYRDGRSHDPNLFFDPVTGYNVNPSAGRPERRRTRRSSTTRATAIAIRRSSRRA